MFVKGSFVPNCLIHLDDIINPSFLKIALLDLLNILKIRYFK